MSNRQGYSKYHESIAKEFEAKINRVRYFIDNNHWGEDGRYKEILSANYLKSVLPSNVSVGTGFVKSTENLSKQIDIIIYRRSEEHTSELQSRFDLVCRLLLEK